MTRIAFGRPTQSFALWLVYHRLDLARAWLRVRCWWRLVRAVTRNPDYPFKAKA